MPAVQIAFLIYYGFVNISLWFKMWPDILNNVLMPLSFL